MEQLLAQTEITNPVLNPLIGTGGASEAPTILAKLIAQAWLTIFLLGGLAVIIFMTMGAVTWITAGGDKGKVEEARNRITGAVIGMAVLFSVFALVNFIFPRLGFNILTPDVPDNLNETTTS